MLFTPPFKLNLLDDAIQAASRAGALHWVSIVAAASVGNFTEIAIYRPDTLKEIDTLLGINVTLTGSAKPQLRSALAATFGGGVGAPNLLLGGAVSDALYVSATPAALDGTLLVQRNTAVTVSSFQTGLPLVSWGAGKALVVTCDTVNIGVSIEALFSEY